MNSHWSPHSPDCEAITFEMTSVFISGTSRGIGLELVKQFLKHDNPPKNIIAACRSPEKAIELNELARRNSNIHVLQLGKSHSSEAFFLLT